MPVPVRSLLLFPALLAACAQGSSPAGQSPAVMPETLATAAITIRDGGGAEAPFHLTELEKLAVEVRVASTVPGTHALRVDVMSPRGTLFAQLPGTVQADDSGQGIFTQNIQVRGTPIEGYHQTGTWTFRAALDGGEPLATAQAEVAE